MTTQTVDDIIEDAERLDDRVIESAKEWQLEHPNLTWVFEYEIPPQTNNWIYIGNQGLAKGANWVAPYPDPRESVYVIINSTHPEDETPISADVYYMDDFNQKAHSEELLHRIEGEAYKTPLWVRQRIFWEAVEWAINYMKENPPSFE